MVGLENNSFELVFQETWFAKGDLIKEFGEYECKIIDIPKYHYFKWYYRILYYLTFTLLFIPKITYTVKILNYEEREDS